MATTIVNKNVPKVHRKEFQMMTYAPATALTGAFVVTDVKEYDNLALYMTSASNAYIYHHDEDSWLQLPNPSLAGTFGAGSCGARSRWSSTLTATGGSTTTATVVGITGLCVGKTVRFLSGPNIGIDRVITGVIINPVGGGVCTIQFDALPNAVANTNTFIIDTGRFWIFNAGTLAAGSYKFYDPLLGTWSAALSITGLPASWGTDGRLVSTPSNDVFATGTATSATTTTLVNSAKTWTASQWINYQVRIVSGTGIGQVRTITANTGTTLTVATWTTTPDATSVYEITGNDDFLYLLGNNAVTMYRYSISGNTWSTITPTAARSGAAQAALSANWVGKTGDANWADESNILDGRFIYSFRGGGGSALDRYDIAGAAGGTWTAITYATGEAFGAGSSYAVDGRYVYIRREATHRYMKYTVRGNYLEPLALNPYPDGTAQLGDKLWIHKYTENGVTKLTWLYSLKNSGNELHRMLLY
jgi:hypothetical protein